MGLFGKSKRRPKPASSPSHPPATAPEANYNNGGGGGYMNNSYSYNDYNNYYNSNPQPWPFDHRHGASDYRRGPPPGEFVAPPQHCGYPYAGDRHHHYYPPAPSWTPGPIDPPAAPAAARTYFMPPPGCSSDEDPNAQCFIM